MRYVFSVLVLSGLLLALPNLAVSGSDQTGIHGGQVRAVGPYHLELVAKDGELQLYVTDQNNRNKIQTKGGSARANISNNDENQVRVDLEPVFGNLMRGSGDFKITPETTVSVLVATSLEKDTHVARFDSLTSQNTPAEATDNDDDHDEDTHESESSDDDD
ncbi:MAG: hypothetical protein LV471_00305 [Nitrosomonas sp.]|nr:hypothetical protein [Nitrosomonas sp.]